MSEERGHAPRPTGYTWQTAVQDIALVTPLTLVQAGELLWQVQVAVPELDPYTAFTALRELLNADSPRDRGHALGRLLRLARETA